MVQTNPKHILVQRILSLPFRGNGFAGMLVAKILFRAIRDTIRVKTLYGFDIMVHGNEDAIIERSVYYTGTYEKGTIHLLQQLLAKGDVFVDAGANIGLMSFVAAQAVGSSGHVHAFEPSPEMYARFKENMLLNGFENITVYPVALAAEAGEALLYPDNAHNPGASSLINNQGHVKPIAVKKQTLDEYTIHSPVVVLKVDVEGYEMEVLKGAEQLLSRNDAPALIVECSTQRENHGYNADELYEFIRGINQYRIFKLKRGKGHISALVEIKTTTDLPVHDNLFCLMPAQLKKIKHE